jgi:hypothetical protein
MLQPERHYALYKIINNQKRALFVLYNIISLPTPILDGRKHLCLSKNQKLFYIAWIPDILEKKSPSMMDGLCLEMCLHIN